MLDRNPIDRTAEIERIRKKLGILGNSSTNLTGGDLDNDWYQASVGGGKKPSEETIPPQTKM